MIYNDYNNIKYVGEQNAGMFYHEDVLPVGSYQIQLQGRKKWIICQPKLKPSKGKTLHRKLKEDLWLVIQCM